MLNIGFLRDSIGLANKRSMASGAHCAIVVFESVGQTAQSFHHFRNGRVKQNDGEPPEGVGGVEHRGGAWCTAGKPEAEERHRGPGKRHKTAAEEGAGGRGPGGRRPGRAGVHGVPGAPAVETHPRLQQRARRLLGLSSQGGNSIRFLGPKRAPIPAQKLARKTM